MNSNSPAVTVLIATYNKASTLGYAIDSVLWQTYQDFELWVVGDGCTDNSAEVVEAYEDPRVNWYNLPKNSGYQSEPHNEGLRRAKGKYIAYLNHDDIWLPNHLQVLVNCLEEKGVDFAYTILEWVLSYADSYADIPHYPAAPRPPEASATLHYRDIVDQIGYWKSPQETYAVPRAEYFRRAEFAGKRFELVPQLTILKFGGSPGAYSNVGQQPEYIQRIQQDKDFVHKELGDLLAKSYAQLERPTSLKRYIHQVAEAARRFLIKCQINPARLIFWQKPGRHIRKWRKAQKLE